ncbi:MAG: hypothetical protein M3Q65_23605, partial [Chloroflexota bacterium]|nr:hypothetical protein [Chloroflexota bacterium]
MTATSLLIQPFDLRAASEREYDLLNGFYNRVRAEPHLVSASLTHTDRQAGRRSASMRGRLQALTPCSRPLLTINLP